jgi:putative transposase
LERKRIEFPGACYHVVQRGNNKENIFRKVKDKESYLDNLTDLKSKYDFLLLGYALMDNHYHLLIRTGEDPLNKIIFRQNIYYSRYFNKAHNRSGHLYGDRYKASVVQDDQHLFAVLRYIHWNPVKAGICAAPEQYRWSSDKLYRNNIADPVDIDFILNIISANRKNAILQYKRQMKIEDEVSYDEIKFVGDEEFVEQFELNRSELKKGLIRKSLDDILADTGVDIEAFKLIKSGSRKRCLSSYKKKYIKEAIEQGYSYREIGKNIKISCSAVALQIDANN